MPQIAFVTPFTGTSLSRRRSPFPTCPQRGRVVPPRVSVTPTSRLRLMSHRNSPQPDASPPPTPLPSTSSPSPSRAKRIAIVAKASTASKKKQQAEVTVEADSSSRGGFFGLRAQAYWDSMGALPLFFTGFGIVALAVKMVKMQRGQMRAGDSGVNKVAVPKTVITSEEEEAELHVFKCGGCGYEIYPARGREFKFFPDSFKCPLCGTPKSEFWDLNDPDDPRNHTDDEDEDEDDDDDDGDDGGNGAGHELQLPDVSPSTQSPSTIESTVQATDASEALSNESTSPNSSSAT